MAKKELFFIIVILGLAGFLRFAQLDSIPPGIYPDEAINANQAIDSFGKIFYPENNGREGLFINLIGVCFKIFGISIWSARSVSAILGTLTVLGIYFLTKELFGQEKILSPALSALFLATSFWHINFSRIIFRAIMVPFCLVFFLLFLLRGYRKQKLVNFIIAGVFFGLGFHTYIAFRFAVLILPFIFLTWFLVYRKQKAIKNFFIFTSTFLGSTFFIALPIGLYFLKNPGDFLARGGNVSIFNQANPLIALAKSVILHLSMFNFYGDPNWRHNISTRPILFAPIGIFFLVGLLHSIKKLIQTIKDKDWKKSGTYILLLSWWSIMLLPGVMTIESIPHSLRVIGCIPPTFIFAGLGAVIVYRKISRLFKDKFDFKKTKSNRLLVSSCILLLGLCFCSAQYLRYFKIWGENKETEKAFSAHCVNIGNYLNSLPEQTLKYVIINEPGPHIPLPVQTILFTQRTQGKEDNTKYIFEDELEKVDMSGKKTVIVLMDRNEDIVNEIQSIFPNGELSENNNIWIYQKN